jgi:prepilin-type N-terminal cleavage/methylation domain-containing protein
MNTLRRPSSEAGFTLIECLIAIIVLVFGLIGITNLFVVATASNQIGNLTTAAAAKSSEALEEIKSLPFTTLVPGGSLTADLPSTNTTSDVTANTYNMQETLTGVGIVKTRWVIMNPNASGTDTYYITVRSEVQGPFGGPLSRAEYSTFRTCSTLGCPTVPVP